MFKWSNKQNNIHKLNSENKTLPSTIKNLEHTQFSWSLAGSKSAIVLHLLSIEPTFLWLFGVI